MKTALAAAILAFCVGPASAQFSLPDSLPALDDDAAVCNRTRTHCIVNFTDWMTDKVAVPLAAHKLLALQKRIEDLEAELERERADKTRRCAKVTVNPDETCKRS